MTRANRGRSQVLPRMVAVSLCVGLIAVLGQGTGAAITKRQVEQAEARVKQLQSEIAAQQQILDRLGAQANAIAQAVLKAQSDLEATQAKLATLHERIDATQARYDARVKLLTDRAVAAYMNGGGSNLEFLLGASSITDLSDRLAFVDRVTQSDAAIAAEVQSLRNQLREDQADMKKLEAQQQRVVANLRQKQSELRAKFEQQRAVQDSIKAKLAEARRYAAKIGKRYQAQLAAQYSGGAVVSNGTFKVCPVDQPRAFGDDFGAPRYSGGFHLHAGNDILAPLGTPIRAPFDGAASVSSNGLGGLSVNVSGAAGYVYNAHLSRIGQLGSVHAGDIVGYVGNSGDAAGGPYHDHFEWHPNAIPSNWPESGYGYSVIGDAVNPHPLLLSVC